MVLPDEENKLLLQIAEGDEKAFRILFDRYHLRLYSYIFKIVKSSDVAEELVMDVFLKLWLGRDMMTEIQNLEGFLFRVAYNKSIDFFRAAKNDKRFSDLLLEKIQIASSSDADTALLTHEYEAKLREALNLLPPPAKKNLPVKPRGRSFPCTNCRRARNF